MKKLIILILFAPFFIFSQELKIDEKTGMYTKQDIMVFDSISKEEIFNKTIEWISLNYNSANDVIQLRDNVNGKIILKGMYTTNFYIKEGVIKHTAVIDIKENKLRYTYTDFIYDSQGSGAMSFEKPLTSKKKLIEKTNGYINNSMNSLKDYIKNNIKADDNW